MLEQTKSSVATTVLQKLRTMPKTSMRETLTIFFSYANLQREELPYHVEQRPPHKPDEHKQAR